jgi:hypothetical protein
MNIKVIIDMYAQILNTVCSEYKTIFKFVLIINNNNKKTI